MVRSDFQHLSVASFPDLVDWEARMVTEAQQSLVLRSNFASKFLTKRVREVLIETEKYREDILEARKSRAGI